MNINFKKVLYPLSTLIGSFFGLLSLIKVSSINQNQSIDELLIILVAAGGSCFISTWGPFFTLTQKEQKPFLEITILILPLIVISSITLMFSLSLSLSFFVGGIQSIIFQILISKKKGVYTIFWPLFIHSAVIISLYLPFPFIVEHWSYFYPSIYILNLLFYFYILRLITINSIVDFFRNIKSKVQKLAIKFKKISGNEKRYFSSSEFLSRILLAFLTSSLFFVSAILITVVAPFNQIPLLLLFDKISFSISSALIKRFLVKGFFEVESLKISTKLVFYSSILSTLSIILFILLSLNLNIFPFNLGLIAQTIDSLDIYYNSHNYFDILKLIAIIMIISLGNAIQINTSYPLRALQFISQDNLRGLNLKSNKISSYYFKLLIGVFLGFLFLISQTSNNLSLNKLFSETQIYHFIPVILILCWWIFVANWAMFAKRYLLKK